jgi:glutathione peroxidase
MFTLFISSMLFLLQTIGSVHEFKVQGIDGKTIDFTKYKGKKILIVNTASECGYTRQYAALQELSEKYKDELVVIGVPANNFGGQEPGSDSDIKEFCSKTYQVTFPMAAKVSVKGADMAPLFKWLTSQENPDFTGDIRWNFEKFLIDEKGKLIRRYRSGVKPLDAEITGQL